MKRAAEFRPHVVLCDIGLPDMDGYEVVQQLRTEPRTAPALLIALTGYASHLDKERAARAGFHHHLSKPPSIENIRELLESHTRSDLGRLNN